MGSRLVDSFEIRVMMEKRRVYDVAMLSHDHIARTEASRMIDVEVIILRMTRFHKFMFEKKKCSRTIKCLVKVIFTSKDHRKSDV